MAAVGTMDTTDLHGAPRGGTRQVPPTWQQALKLARFQLRDYLRSRRFILMMGIVGVIGAILTAVIGYYRPASMLQGSQSFYYGLWAGGVTIVIVFAGIIFGGDAIAGEFSNKTGYFLMGLPLRRVTVYVGKYIAAFIASFVSLVAFALIIVGNGTFYFGWSALTLAFLESFLLSTAYLLALLGATFLFSSLFKTSTYATLVVAVLFIFGFSVLEELVAGLANVEPWFIISYASPVIGYPFLSAVPEHTRTFGPGSHFILYNPTYQEGIAIIIGYFIVTALVGLYLFEREEFT